MEKLLTQKRTAMYLLIGLLLGLFVHACGQSQSERISLERAMLMERLEDMESKVPHHQRPSVWREPPLPDNTDPGVKFGQFIRDFQSEKELGAGFMKRYEGIESQIADLDKDPKLYFYKKEEFRKNRASRPAELNVDQPIEVRIQR